MKKAKKLIAGIALSAMLLTGCNFNRDNSPYTPGDGNTFRQQDIYMLYKAAGGEMTYEEWLNTIRGADGSSLRAGISDPDNSEGNNGDVYVNTASWDVFLKVGGSWQLMGNVKGEKGDPGADGRDGIDGKDGKDGIDGKDGKDGKDGIDGKDGKDGQDGQDGQDGKDGASILYGYGRPADSKGNDGDCFIDMGNFDFYTKELGHWVKQSNMKEELRWEPEIEAAMIKYFGEALPFADLDTETLDLFIDDSYAAWFGVSDYYFYDMSEFNVLSSYGEKLEAYGYEYDDYYEAYNKGDLWVDFEYDDMNIIHVQGPAYIEWNADYFLDNDFEQVDGWPQAHVDTTMGAGKFAGVNNDGVWYELFELDGDESEPQDSYYKDLLATEGDYFDELTAQIVAAGYKWNERRSCYYDDDHDAEIHLNTKDGFTLIEFYGAYLAPIDDDYFLDQNYSKVTGWPEDVIALAYEEENQFDGVNADGEWFVKYSTEAGSGTHAGYSRTSGSIITKGNFEDALIENVLAAGFEYEEDYDDFAIMADSNNSYLSVYFSRGYTFLSFHGSYIKDEDAPALPGVDGVDALIEAFFAANNVNVDLPEFVSANANAHYEESSSASIFYIYGVTQEEMTAYGESLQAAGWTYKVTIVSDGDFEATLASGNTTLTIKMANYLSWYDYVKVTLSVSTRLSVAEANNAFAAFFAEKDANIPFAGYAAADASAYAAPYASASQGTVAYDIFNTTKDEVTAYGNALQQLGWTVNVTHNDGDFTANFGGAQVKLYVYNSTKIRITCSYTQTYTAAEISAYMVSFFSSLQVDVQVADYATASAGAYFLYYPEYIANGEFVARVFGTNETEMSAYVAAMEAVGWVAEVYSTGVELVYANTGAVLQVQNKLSSDGYVQLVGFYREPPVVSNTFPVDSVNAFLNQYSSSFGFTLSEPSITFPEGTQFEVSVTEDSYGYPLLIVEINCDCYNDMITYIGAALANSPYTWEWDDTYGYTSSDYRQIGIWLSEGKTYIYFYTI